MTSALANMSAAVVNMQLALDVLYTIPGTHETQHEIVLLKGCAAQVMQRMLQQDVEEATEAAEADQEAEGEDDIPHGTEPEDEELGDPIAAIFSGRPQFNQQKRIWNAKDDHSGKMMFNAGISLNTIAAFLGRTRKAIYERSRIWREEG